MKLLQIHIKDSLWKSIHETASLRSVTIEHYFEELAEVDTAPLRLQKARSTFLLPSGAPAEKIEASTDNHRTKLGPGEVQRLIFLAEHLPVPAIAERMNIGRSTVRRILEQRAQANRTAVPGASSSRRSRQRQADA